jgi:hypothetical protein
MWDMEDQELARRVQHEKKRKAAGRKALRMAQKAGKTERRAARDEKRKVYRELKHTWKAIKGRIGPANLFSADKSPQRKKNDTEL